MHKIIILRLFNCLNAISEEMHKVKINETIDNISSYFRESMRIPNYKPGDKQPNYSNTELLQINMWHEIDFQFACALSPKPTFSYASNLTPLLRGKIIKLFMSYDKKNIYTDLVDAYIYLYNKIKLFFPKYAYDAILMTEYDLISERLNNNKKINDIIRSDAMKSYKHDVSRIDYNCFSRDFKNLKNNSIYDYTPITRDNCLFIDNADRDVLIIFKHIIEYIHTEFIALCEKREYEKIAIDRIEKEEKEKNERYNCSVQ